MAIISTHNPWVFIFGILGNISSFVVFIAPIPTFYRIYKKKSTEGFDSLPYLAGLFSAMLWIYYASLKSDAFLLITINAFGCFIETIYIALYITYAPKQAKRFTWKILCLLNFGGFCGILLLSHFLTKGSLRVEVLGWICVAFSFCVFVAPLSVMRLVIRTKSVEFMPIHLSFFLTVTAVTWLLYGIFLKDIYVAIPNILGFVFGMLQMILYAVYRNKSKLKAIEEAKLPQPQLNIDIVPQLDMTAAITAITSEEDCRDKSKVEEVVGSNKEQNHNGNGRCGGGDVFVDVSSVPKTVEV